MIFCRVADLRFASGLEDRRISIELGCGSVLWLRCPRTSLAGTIRDIGWGGLLLLISMSELSDSVVDTHVAELPFCTPVRPGLLEDPECGLRGDLEIISLVVLRDTL